MWIIKQVIGQGGPQEPGADSSTAGTSTTISSGGAGTGEVEITYGPNTVNYSGKAYEIFSAPEQGIEGESQMREFCAKRGGRLAEGTRKDICSFLGRLVLNSGIQDAVIENCQHCQEQLGINRTVFSDDSDYFICEWDGEKWHKKSYLSLAGIGNGKTVPKALEQFLKDYPNISHIHLLLDSDEPGRIAAQNIKAALGDRYIIKYMPPPNGKDYNEFLQSKNTKGKQPKPIRR